MTALRFISGMLLAVLALELLARLLPVSTATRTTYTEGSDLLTYPAGHRWTAATGWDLKNAQTLNANNAGFASDEDFKSGTNAIGLVGDSYVEASMLPAADRPAAQLRAALGGNAPVYPLGAPGTALLDYAHRIAWANRTYGIERFVVMVEPGDVRQSWCGSGNVHAHCLNPESGRREVVKLDSSSRAKELLRESALAQYLVSQLRLEPNKLIDRLFADPVPPEPGSVKKPAGIADVRTEAERTRTQERARQVMASFVAMLKDVPVESILFVVNANTAMPKSGRAQVAPFAPALEQERAVLIEELRRAGYPVLDATPVFEHHWKHSRLSLVVGPYDGHLNGLAVGLLMTRAAEMLGVTHRQPQSSGSGV